MGQSGSFGVSRGRSGVNKGCWGSARLIRGQHSSFRGEQRLFELNWGYLGSMDVNDI